MTDLSHRGAVHILKPRPVLKFENMQTSFLFRVFLFRHNVGHPIVTNLRGHKKRCESSQMSRTPPLVKFPKPVYQASKTVSVYMAKQLYDDELFSLVLT